ncbi:MAG TPA: phosphatidylinositol mannoside acyltransferase [Segeticoccus sp.]|uniref:phosphatidylinositol mannoside acyltransferase n=1 Tax=Segeticoccus sp. TaxID=2706531 RepID=UPI002D7E69D7|nr:phosphatidylinositol mannoside acyltransferase [Segeticoccus sp.]HET8601627.1 phosphatidylinositol mannoside acyltransferase [Segeticoccus sp.]
MTHPATRSAPLRYLAGTPGRERLTVLAFRTGWRLVRRMPGRLAYRAFDVGAELAYRRGRGRRGSSVERLRTNYALVRPELDADRLEALVRAGMRSYLRYWCDAFRLPELTREQRLASMRVVGLDPLRAHVDSGGATVMFLGHLGNWDLAGAWCTTELVPVTTVAERLEPEELFAEFVAYRESLGMRILPLTGPGGRPSDVFGELTAALRGGGFVPLLADRDLTSGGIEVDFCGRRARMAVGPAALALTTGAALFPVSVTYEPADPQATGGSAHRIRVEVHDRVHPPGQGRTRDQVRVMTQQCADALAGTVREHTEDWHMMQRVFVNPREVAGAARQGVEAR